MLSHITAVHRSSTHSFSKTTQLYIQLLEGLGVEGDAHCGALVQHRYQLRKDPSQPNLCQVHLLQQELLDELDIPAGLLGENITTLNLDLLSLPTGTRLTLGATAIVEVTGLRMPCDQINKLRPGLMKRCFAPKTKVPRAGIMTIVITGGTVQPTDTIEVKLPPYPHRPLICV